MASLSRAIVAPVDRLRSWGMRMRRRAVDSDGPALVFLVVLVLALVVAGTIRHGVVQETAILVPIFLGSWWLGPRTLPWFVAFSLLGVGTLVVAEQAWDGRTVVRLVVTAVIATIIIVSAFRRAQLGVSGGRGESMFVDLRDRIAKQGVVPELPDPWHVESGVRPAGGTSFSGDFIVASKSTDGTTLDLAVVDVSGKGIEAGTRSLLLSGAFAGLASAVSAERFLADANEYLLRQRWGEGFATAIHLHLDLDTGAFELRKAGHPPAVWLHAGSGRWSVLDSEGPVLGLIDEARFDVVRGRLLPDDALLLYTDGLVETVSRDIGSGIDKLAGRGQLLFRSGYVDAAAILLDQLAREDDDGALILVHRRPTIARLWE